MKLPSFNLPFPEGSSRFIAGILFAALALIFLFGFFEKAGAAGELLVSFSRYLFGDAVFLFPLLLIMTSVALLSTKEERVSSAIFAFLLTIISITGIVGSFARMQGIEPGDISGFLGFAVSWPVFGAFGFWVSEIIFVALFAISGVMFWKLIPHREKNPEFKVEPAEKLKKVFAEPKFEVEKVEVLQIHDAAQEEKKKAQKESKKETIKKKQETIAFLGDYKLPGTELLEQESGTPNAGDIQAYSAIIRKTFQNFDIPVEVTEVNVGPTVTQYAIKPSEGIKLTRITGLSNDLALALAAHPIRIEAPIPGRALVGIEVPNKTRSQVRLRALLESETYKNSNASLPLALGRDVSGATMFADLARMPHLLVAGATGAGKTIGLNNIIMSLLYHNSPSNLRFVLVDPKRVEFPVYNDLPHLLTPVILDTQRTINALKWLIKEMERRFQVFSEVRARDIRSYHAMYTEQKKRGQEEMEQIPYIVLVIDELADLMAARGKEMEGMIVRLAQMSRAVGIHLVLATQRPSVEVITGTIKANITSRIAFQVASQIDSRTILDAAGAEKLLGQGDMLFISSEFSKPKRIQGAFVGEKEVKKVVEWIAEETKDFARQEIAEDDLSQSARESLEAPEFGDDEDDPLYEEAKRIVVEYQKASASLLQRRLKVGYARAARLLDILESKGVIGHGEGAKPREVFITREGSATMPFTEPMEDSIIAPKETPKTEQEQEEGSKWFAP